MDIYDIFKKMVGTKGAFSVDLMITMKCNLSCDYCIQNKNLILPKWSIPNIIKTADAIGQATNNEGSLSLIGGEPLLHKRLIMDFLDRQLPEIQYRLITNGLLLDKEVIDLVYTHKKSFVGISLDGFGNTNRNTTVDQQIKILNNFNYISNTYGRYNTICYLSITDKSLPMLEYTMNTLYSCGVGNIMYNLPDLNIDFVKLISITQKFLNDHPDVDMEIGEGIPKTFLNDEFQFCNVSIDASGIISTLYYHGDRDYLFGIVDFTGKNGFIQNKQHPIAHCPGCCFDECVPHFIWDSNCTKTIALRYLLRNKPTRGS